jgi:diguanylate cyclase (GGDEF)-like protein/PAS domain S-box-containing protein
MSKVRELHVPEKALLGPGPPTAEETMFRLLVNSVRDYGIFLLDETGVIQSWNVGAQLITHFEPEEVVGQHFSVLYTPEEIDAGWPQREMETAARLGRVEDEGWRLRRNGERFWANVVITAMRGPDGALQGYSKILRDLTERKKHEDSLKRGMERSRQLWTQAIKDPLTGAFNRRYMLEQLRGAIERGGWMTASLLLADIDSFKAINDQLGHVAGDTVLMGVAGIGRRLSRDSDQLFRMGGDEFVLYLPGAGLTGARATAERLRAAVEQSKLVKDMPLSVSIGVAELQAKDTVETWIKRADSALYEAKRAGRNRVA